MSAKVKICGITNLEDAQLAAKHGADYLGVLVDVAISPRSKTILEAKEIFASSYIPVIALVYNISPQKALQLIQELQPYALQFVAEGEFETIAVIKQHYPAIKIWQSLHLPAGEIFEISAVTAAAQSYLQAGVDVLLLDTMVQTNGQKQFGGTGKTSNWNLAAQLIAQIPAPIMLAGGLNPDNVLQAIDLTKPYGVDVSSGVESIKGKKDEQKIKEFLEKATQGHVNLSES